MARHVSVATAIEKNKIASDKAFVLLFSVDVTNFEGTVIETLRLARNSENIIYHGQEYQAANFEVQIKEDIEQQPTLSIDAEDPTGFIRDRMEVYSGAVGSPVTLYVVNTDNLAQSPEIEENFKVIEGSATGSQVSFKLGVENPLTVRFPTRLQYKDQCPYQYKGPRCKYAGALATCDFTYDGANGCRAHDNIVNFGGFRGIQRLLTN